MKLRAVIVGGVILITAACGSGGEGTVSQANTGGGSSTCTSTGKRICERACACGSGGECETGIPNAAGTFTTLTWSDRADCEAGYAGMRCASPPAIDYAACASAIEAAACEGSVFVVPESCEEPRDAGQ